MEKDKDLGAVTRDDNTDYVFYFDSMYRPAKEATIVLKDNCADLPDDCHTVFQVIIPESGVPIDGKLIYNIHNGKIHFATVNAVTQRQIILPNELIVVYMTFGKYQEIKDSEKFLGSRDAMYRRIMAHEW